MHPSANAKPARYAFTLVEMLVVIVIIGILMGFLAGAVIRARRTVNLGVIKSEIKQLDMTVTNCGTEFGMAPPDFMDADGVRRYIRKAFPKYKFIPGPGDVPADFVSPPDPLLQMLLDISNPPNHPRRPGYGITIDLATNPTALGPDSALLFWLGGLPETAPAPGSAWVPAGFHSDPTNPFKPGLPRTDPLFKFDPKRIPVDDTTGWPFEAHPDDPTNPDMYRFFHYLPAGIEVPYVYFEARRTGGSMGYILPGGGVQVSYYHSAGDPASGTPANWCVAYRDPKDPPGWRNHDTWQIITAGPDNEFGESDRTVLRESKTHTGFTDGDYDNITNFIETSTLGDETE